MSSDDESKTDHKHQRPAKCRFRSRKAATHQAEYQQAECSVYDAREKLDSLDLELKSYSQNIEQYTKKLQDAAAANDETKQSECTNRIAKSERIRDELLVERSELEEEVAMLEKELERLKGSAPDDVPDS